MRQFFQKRIYPKYLKYSNYCKYIAFALLLKFGNEQRLRNEIPLNDSTIRLNQPFISRVVPSGELNVLEIRGGNVDSEPITEVEKSKTNSKEDKSKTTKSKSEKKSKSSELDPLNFLKRSLDDQKKSSAPSYGGGDDPNFSAPPPNGVASKVTFRTIIERESETTRTTVSDSVSQKVGVVETSRNKESTSQDNKVKESITKTRIEKIF